ncbi:hypothetical protein [Brucella microti]
MQIDLFTNRKPASVHTFPLARRRKLVNATVNALDGRNIQQDKLIGIAL